MILKRFFREIVSLIIFSIVWEIGSRALSNPLYPSFTEVLGLYLNTYFLFILFTNYIYTFIRATLGFILGTFAGLTTGFLLSRSKINEYIQPIATLFFSVPSIAWIPLLIIWIGLKEYELPIASSFLCSYPPILYGVLNIFRTYDREQVETALVLGADPKTILYRIIIPQSIPKLLPIMKIEAIMVWKTVFVVEMLVLPNGLGYLAYLYASSIHIDELLAVIILLALNTLALIKLFDLFEEKISNKLFGASKWYQ